MLPDESPGTDCNISMIDEGRVELYKTFMLLVLLSMSLTV